MRKILLISAVAFFAVACGSPIQKAHKSIERYLSENLYSSRSYSPGQFSAPKESTKWVITGVSEYKDEEGSPRLKFDSVLYNLYEIQHTFRAVTPVGVEISVDYNFLVNKNNLEVIDYKCSDADDVVMKQ